MMSDMIDKLEAEHADVAECKLAIKILNIYFVTSDTVPSSFDGKGSGMTYMCEVIESHLTMVMY